MRNGPSIMLVALALLAGCGGERPCPRCDTLVISATGEPEAVLPPLVYETVGRDIIDQVWERLAVLKAGAAPIDLTAYQPALASSWERVDSLTWRFHLRPGARWQDGQPVTAEDVRFSFEAFTDSVLDSPARATLEGAIRVTAADSATVLVHFSHAYAEQLYDATWHVRVIPAHRWKDKPRDQWGADTAVADLVGSGPYRITAWQRGQSLTLAADTVGGRRTKIGSVIWRFTPDPDAALNLVLSGEADLMESVGTPERVARVEGDTLLRAVRYPAAAYGFLGYQLKGRQAGALADRAVRRALNASVDRSALATTLYGAGSKAPPGPMSQLLWIWDDSITVPVFDTAAAARELDAAGWKRGGDGMRGRGHTPLSFEILVPTTSAARRRMAELLQERWRLVGAEVRVSAVDFPIFQQRLGAGKFDSYIGAWLDEPSPRSLAEQWTAAGIGALNYGGYTSPGFDALFQRAISATEVPAARALWREAMDTLNADAPALFLYAPMNVAAASRRVQGFEVNPYSWLSGLSSWTLARP